MFMFSLGHCTKIAESQTRVMIVHCVNNNDRVPCYDDVLWFLEVGSKYVEDNASTLQ